ncbi:hypothetical protein FB595_13616, partial [Sphingobium sp. AEW010]
KVPENESWVIPATQWARGRPNHARDHLWVRASSLGCLQAGDICQPPKRADHRRHGRLIDQLGNYRLAQLPGDGRRQSECHWECARGAGFGSPAASPACSGFPSVDCATSHCRDGSRRIPHHDDHMDGPVLRFATSCPARPHFTLTMAVQRSRQLVARATSVAMPAHSRSASFTGLASRALPTRP